MVGPVVPVVVLVAVVGEEAPSAAVVDQEAFLVDDLLPTTLHTPLTGLGVRHVVTMTSAVILSLMVETLVVLLRLEGQYA